MNTLHTSSEKVQNSLNSSQLGLSPTSSIFSHSDFGDIRIFEDSANELWFVAKDVADALDYTWSGTRIAHIPSEWKGVTSVVTPGGRQDLSTLSEQGLYFFLARSDKPKALPFQMWLAGEVLPSIRKHGMYATPQTLEALISDPDTAIKLLQSLKAEQERIKTLEQQAALDAPRVFFSKVVEGAKTSISVGEMGKIIEQATKIGMGQNRFYIFLRENGYVHKDGCQHNMPTQRSIEAGWMEIKEGTRTNATGETVITRTTKITGKGQIYFVGLFKKIAEQEVENA